MTPGPAPLRFLNARVRAGTACAELTLEAVENWLIATHREPRRAAWVADTLGEKASAGWLLLGCYPQRIVRDAGGWVPALEREGVPAIIVPQWIACPDHHAGLCVVDLVAIDPRMPAAPISRAGLVDGLGAVELERALDEGGACVIWHDDALAWLRGGGNAERFVGGDTSAVRFFPFASDCGLVERVLLEAGDVIAQTVALGDHLAELADALRRLRMPRRVPIAVAAADLEG